MSQPRQFCTFFLDGLFFGVDVQQVQEVIRQQKMTRVPLAPAMVRGLINLRGQIVTAIALRERFGLPPADPATESANVVVRTEDGPMSLLVDEIGDVIEVEEEMFETAPENLTAIAREVTVGVYKLERRLLLVLDVEKTVQLPNSPLGRDSAELAAHA
jgi:purine-binding chemotaxis protein CheW